MNSTMIRTLLGSKVSGGFYFRLVRIEIRNDNFERGTRLVESNKRRWFAERKKFQTINQKEKTSLSTRIGYSIFEHSTIDVCIKFFPTRNNRR